MEKLKKKNYKFNDKAINNGLMFLFLAGCLLIMLVGGYTLMATYNNKNKTISSNNMNISSTKDQAIAEDNNGKAYIVK